MPRKVFEPKGVKVTEGQRSQYKEVGAVHQKILRWSDQEELNGLSV